MIQLTNETFRDFLGDIFFTSGDKAQYIKYIIPMQGNWWLPTENDKSISTWIGYNIVERKSYIRAREVSNDTGNASILSCIAKVHLQFIGKDAEKFALSILHWDERYDIAEAFHRFAGQLFYEERKIIASSYFQDGQNSTLSQNIDFRFLFVDTVEPQQEILIGAEVTGNIIY